MPRIEFPRIPDLPGVPLIPRGPDTGPSPIVQAALGALQGIIWRMFRVQERWGIYDKDGTPLGNPATFTSFIGSAIESLGFGTVSSTGAVDYSKETRVSDYPVEGGKFISYNKVELPATPRVTIHMEGSESARRAFLEALDEACKSTAAYSVVTPDAEYIGYSITSYQYSRRSEDGATLLIVEISLSEVLEASARYSTSIPAASDPGSVPTKDNGIVQPIKAKSSIINDMYKKVSSNTFFDFSKITQ